MSYRSLSTYILIFTFTASASQAHRQNNPPADHRSGDHRNIVLYFDGKPNANTESLPAQFGSCPLCSGTTTFTATDPTNNRPLAKLKVWADNGSFIFNGTGLCFTEYIEYDFYNKGKVYTAGHPVGTCGGIVAPTLIPPPTGMVGDYVVVGGGAGDIVEATGSVSYLKNGTYNDRVFVELTPNNEIVYYSGLYFTLFSPKKAHEERKD